MTRLASLLRLAVLAAVPALLASGCAFTSETIQIGYPEPAGVARVAGAETIRVKIEAVDRRTDPSLVVARKINGFGMQTAKISNKVPATVVLANAVATELRARGYVVAEDGNVPLVLELTVFAHEFRTGFLAGKSEATVSFLATVRDAAGKELFRENVSAPYSHSVQVAGGANVQKAYENALKLAAGKLVSSEAFQKSLAGAAGPSLM